MRSILVPLPPLPASTLRSDKHLDIPKNTPSLEALAFEPDLRQQLTSKATRKANHTPVPASKRSAPDGPIVLLDFPSKGATDPNSVMDLRDRLHKQRRVSFSPNTVNHELTTYNLAVPRRPLAAPEPSDEASADACPAAVPPLPADPSLSDLSKEDLLKIIANMAKSRFTTSNAGPPTDDASGASPGNRRKRHRTPGALTRNQRRSRAAKRTAQAPAIERIPTQASSAQQTIPHSEAEAALDFNGAAPCPTPPAGEEDTLGSPIPADVTSELLGEPLDSSNDELDVETEADGTPDGSAASAPTPPTLPPHDRATPPAHLSKRSGSAYTMTPHMREALTQRNIPLQRALDIAHGDFSAAEAIRPRLERLAHSTMVAPGVTLIELVHIAATQKPRAKRPAPSSHQLITSRPCATLPASTSQLQPLPPFFEPRPPPALSASPTPPQSPGLTHIQEIPTTDHAARTHHTLGGPPTCPEPSDTHTPSMPGRNSLTSSPSQSDFSRPSTPFEPTESILPFTPSPPTRNHDTSTHRVDIIRKHVSLTWATPTPQ